MSRAKSPWDGQWSERALSASQPPESWGALGQAKARHRHTYMFNRPGTLTRLPPWLPLGTKTPLCPVTPQPNPSLLPSAGSFQPREGRTAAWRHKESQPEAEGVRIFHQDKDRGDAGGVSFPWGLPTPSSQPIWTRTTARSILNPAVSIETKVSATRPPTPSGLRGPRAVP